MKIDLTNYKSKTTSANKKPITNPRVAGADLL